MAKDKEGGRWLLKEQMSTKHLENLVPKQMTTSHIQDALQPPGGQPTSTQQPSSTGESTNQTAAEPDQSSKG